MRRKNWANLAGILVILSTTSFGGQHGAGKSAPVGRAWAERGDDWLVAEHQKRFNVPPDFFTCGGFAAAMSVVAAVEKAKSTDSEKLISAMEGMSFQTPKGEMIFRKEDHQALQSMYAFKIKVDPDVKWAIPELVRELKIEDMDIPIRNKR